MIASYPCPCGEDSGNREFALSFDHERPWRLLIVPALFDEGNRMRRLTVDVMRRLDSAGIDSFLPDLPGCNESLLLLEDQTSGLWRAAMKAAAVHFRASHVLAVRGGALIVPDGLPGWHYAPVKGANLLRQMLRARILSAREAGASETQESLLEAGQECGVTLAGYRLGAEFFGELLSLVPTVAPDIAHIDQDMLGGSGLWLRAEPDEDRHQADALAAIVAVGIKS